LTKSGGSTAGSSDEHAPSISIDAMAANENNDFFLTSSLKNRVFYKRLNDNIL